MNTQFYFPLIVPLVAACGGSVSGNEPDVGDASADEGSISGCLGGSVATMVALPEGYRIDSTEVTRCQYQAWLDTDPQLDMQDPWCMWNTDFQPKGVDCGFPPAKDGDLPAGCVDWCDAYAYCKGVGKRLCGRIGGGPNAMEHHADATKSQWYNACSSGGKYQYTYGDPYDYGSRCNDADTVPNDFTVCGSLAQCQSPDKGYAGVFDLSGNVWEWEDSCDHDVGASDYCQTRGGSLRSGEWYSSCYKESWATRGNVAANFGFRCCSD